jgi:transcriptional regulator with XRE-family HTH domain
VTTDASSPAIAHLGDRLREARLNARLTAREAAARIGLRAHGTLIQYENGNVLPPLDRLAALAQAYDISLAGLVVTHDTLIPVVTMLEHATAPQIAAFAELLQHAVEPLADEAPG